MYKIDNNIPFIRFNHIGNKIIMTNIFWESIILKKKEFDNYINWKKIDEKLKNILENKLFSKNENYNELAIKKYYQRNAINFIWPTLHIIVLTKWCNHQCKYCHASADYRYTNDELKLNEENATKIIDIILTSPSKNITIEFQWWEPVSNMKILEYIINYCEKQNKVTKKNIRYALVSNLTLINDNILERLFNLPNLSISTSLDWDKKIHDFNRLMISDKKNISSFDCLKEKIELIRKKEKEKWKKILYWAMWVITSKSINKYKKIVDTYVELWFDNIFLKKINSIWFAQKWKNFLWYSKDELISFYKNYFNYLAKKNSEWIFIKDWFLEIGIKKITNPWSVNFMDLRSPCWAWIWQIAYDYNWKIYTCDEWRMIENDTFLIWNTNNSLTELIQNEIVWIMMDSSTLESLPCDLCAYAPFCWVCPVESYQARWNIYTNQIFDEHCSFFMFIYDYIFEIFDKKIWNKYEYLKRYKIEEKNPNI